MLEGVLNDVDDPEMKYKLRSARQLMLVVQQRHDTLDEAIDTAVDDEAILSNLRDLGYID